LTRDQIRLVMAPRKSAAAVPGAAATAPRAQAPVPAAVPPARAAGTERPVLPPEIQQFFVPATVAGPAGAALAYEPMAVGVASVAFSDAKRSISCTRALTVLAEIDARLGSVAWADGAPLDISARDLESEPRVDARFLDLVPAAAKAKSYDSWTKSLKAWLGQGQTLALLVSPSAGVVSAPEESERDFRIRLQTVAREQRDEAVAKLRQTYAAKIASLDERIRRAQQAVERESEQASAQKLQTVVSMGATVLGALFGSRKITTSTLGRATTAARGVGRSMKESQDIARAQESLSALEQQKADLEAQIHADVASLGGAMDPLKEALEPLVLRPRRTDVSVQLVALAWAPIWIDDQGRRTAAYR